MFHGLLHNTQDYFDLFFIYVVGKVPTTELSL